MKGLRKVTVHLPGDLLEEAQAFTGDGVTQTIKAGLKKLAAIRAQQKMRKLRGTYKFSLSIDELREDRPAPRKTRK